ncbi:MAG: DUF4294 domain-containing protein [Paludibacteraceae bacterium]|nr:DUF4294 domain-containing protein [Paludibacteraceae bacterium]
MRRTICILILSLTTIHAWSNNQQNSPIPSHEMSFVEKVELQVKNNDTFYLARMHDIYVYPKLVFRNKQQERFYWKTVRDVKKTLPFAKLLAQEMVFADQQLAMIPDKKMRKRWWKDHEKYLFKKYEQDFRKMTASQGQMLMKLMDRESDRTSYEIIKHYRGKASANFWQFVAKLFKNDLKEGYDAEDKDRIIERVINLVEAGQL